MSPRFLDDYNPERVTKVRTLRFGFELWVTPRFVHHFEENAYEEMTALLVRQMAKRAGCLIDVGAHYGFYSVLVGLSNPDCSILAFEPVADNAGILRKNFGLHNVAGRVHEVAISDQSGRFPFQISRASDNSGFVANPDGGVLMTSDTETASLDEYLEHIPDGPLIVKIDTEGHEPHVLEGMRELLGGRGDAQLVIEFNPSCLRANGFAPEDLLAKIDELGFEMFFVDDSGMRFERYSHGTSWQDLIGSKSHVNIVCLPKDLALHFCFFSHSSGLEGAERSLLELVDSLVSERGAMCTVVLPSDGPLVHLLNERGAATLPLDYGWWCSDHELDEEAIRQQMALDSVGILRSVPRIEKVKPDVIVTNTMVVPWGAMAAAVLGLPHIWWVEEFGELDHELKFFLPFDQVLRIVDQSSDHIVANSNAVRDFLTKVVDHDHCSVGYCDSIALPAVPNSKREYFHSRESTKLVFVGRATAAKGLDDAILAIRALVDGGHDVELCVAGGVETPFGGEMQRMVSDLGLNDRIHFAGFVENIREVVDQADIGLMCSKCEAFGRVTAEFMILGRSVVGTNTGGTLEIIDDGVNGFVYPPGDVDDLAEKIRFFIENPDSVRDFGARARRSIEGKLQKRPVSELMHNLGREFKGTTAGRRSKRLLAAVLRWQSGRIEDLIRREARLTEETAAQEKQVQAQKTRLADAESDLLDTRERLRDLEALLSERERQAEDLRDRVNALEQHIESLQAGVLDRDGRIEDLKARSEILKEESARLRIELGESVDRFDALRIQFVDITTSRAWRIANLLWRFRISVAPQGSLRARLLQRLGL